MLGRMGKRPPVTDRFGGRGVSTLLSFSSSTGVRFLSLSAVDLRNRFTLTHMSYDVCASRDVDEVSGEVLYVSGGGNSIGLSSNFNLLRLFISPIARGRRVMRLRATAKNFSDVSRLMSSGILARRFLLRSRISSLESWRIYERSVPSFHHMKPITSISSRTAPGNCES